MRAKRSLARQIGEAMSDEQGKFSIGRLLFVLHIALNWLWINAIIFGLATPPDSDVLSVFIGSLDVTIFMVLGAWVIGPRSFQYLFPQIGGLLSRRTTRTESESTYTMEDK